MNRKTTIIAAASLIAVIAAGIFMVTRQNTLEAQNEQLGMQVDLLLEEKANLLEELESLQLAFDSETTRADSLSDLLEQAQDQIAMTAQIRKKQTEDVATLKQEIEQLRQLKNQTESLVAQLQEENEALLVHNAELEDNFDEMQAENTELIERTVNLDLKNEYLEASIAQLRAESVQASNFQIQVGKKSGKQTVNAKKVKAINISFDMANVPVEHQNQQTIYLVISDEFGTPLKVANPIHKRIEANGKIAEIEAQQLQEVKLASNQRLEFQQMMDSKMKAGKYQVTIYSQMGLLGTANFVLS